jgi:Branched-chain amino acid transport protein (AzlD)
MWIAILAGCLGVYLLKLAGLSVPAAVLARPAVQRIAALLPIVLLAALIGVQSLGSGRHVVLDARAAGVAVAAVAVWRKAPFLVVVILGAATTALVRRVVPGA